MRDFSLSVGMVGGMSGPGLDEGVVESASFVTLLYSVLSLVKLNMEGQ